MAFEGVGPFLRDYVQKPHVFYAPKEELATSALQVTKQFYDYSKTLEPPQTEFSPFSELYTEGFEHDQIWEEIASQNGPLLDYIQAEMKNIERRTQEVTLPPESEETSSAGEDGGDIYDVDNEKHDDVSEDQMEEGPEEEYAELSDDAIELEDLKPQSRKRPVDDESEGEDDLEMDRPSKRRSEVDDDFFDLEEFNNWTERVEARDMLSESERSADELEDDAIDFGQDPDDEDDEEDEDGMDAGEDNANEIMYSDFFMPPSKRRDAPSGRPRSNGSLGLKTSESLNDRNGFDGGEDDDEEGENDEVVEEDEEGNEDDEVMEEDGEEEEEEDDEVGFKTSSLFQEDEEMEEEEAKKSEHERRTEKLKKQIEELEQENIAEKQWTMMGEAGAKARPINSLLEEDLDFENVAKPVPVITQEASESIEELIKRRIVEGLFDDVKRKADPTLRPFLPSKQVELSDEKSKKSLAEIYEDDYIKQTSGITTNEKDEALTKEHTEVSNMFKDLCANLDALSNFHYTPKPPKPEITITTNVPSIAMEEVMPVHVSDATRLAPEEVYGKNGVVKGETEMDQADRKKARASRKRQKRVDHKLKAREQRVMAKVNPNASHKYAKVKALEELKSDKNVTLIDREGKMHKRVVDKPSKNYKL